MATAKKSSNKKSTAKKKTVSAKATTKKTSIKNTSSKMVTVEKLRKFNLFTAFVNAVFAVLSVVFLSNKSVEFFMPYSTKDELASTQTTVLGPAYEAVANVELRYLLAVIFGLGAVFSLLLATRLRSKYESGVNNKVSAIRWIFLGVISALTLEFISILGGVTDLVTLKLVAALVLVTALLGWISENQNKAGGSNYAPFYLSLFTGAVAWLPLIVGLIGTAVYGMQAFAWYVYTLAAVVLLGFIAMAVTQYRYIRRSGNTEDYLQVEGKYVSTDFLIRFALFVIIFIALFDK